MNKWQPAHLQNEKVQLIPLHEDSFEELFAVACDPLIWEQHPSNDRYKPDVFKDFFDEAIKTGTAFTIMDTRTGKIIGSTRYYDDFENSIAIGFTFLARKYWGGEYNKAVKKLMLDYAFSLVDNVIFHIGANNIRSQMATAKLGAVKTGEFYKELQSGKTLNYEYTIRKEGYI